MDAVQITTTSAGPYTVVTVAGELDVYSAPRLRQEFIDILAGGCRHIVVDLEPTEFIDSTGLGVLVGGFKRAKSLDGTLSLVCTQPIALKTLRITGLTNVFKIHKTVADATGGWL